MEKRFWIRAFGRGLISGRQLTCTYTVGPCLVRIWIVQVLKNTPDLHSVYYRFLAFSDHLYYSGTCVVRFYIVWFCIVHTFFWILRAHYARTYCNFSSSKNPDIYVNYCQPRNWVVKTINMLQLSSMYSY